MQILLIEDDVQLADRIVGGLRKSGHAVSHCADGRTGLVRATSETYDAIILDRMLPAIGGMKILATLRENQDRTPVLLLSALGDVDDRVKGLKAGGDDYLAKPFAFEELLARIEALGRWKVQWTTQANVIRVGDLHIDADEQLVMRDGERIDLTPREFSLLLHLARNAGRAVTHDMLMESVWGYKVSIKSDVIKEHVSNVRQKLSRAGASQMIHTVHSYGYVLRVE
jgi:two-component system OmpR family response regulator